MRLLTVFSGTLVIGDLLEGGGWRPRASERPRVVRRELVHRAGDALLELGPGRFPFHAGPWIGRLFTQGRTISLLAPGLVERRVLAERAFAELVDGEVPRDCVDPRCEVSFVLEIRSVLDDADERLLDDVLGQRLNADLPEGKVEKRSLMAADELGKRRTISCPGSEASALRPAGPRIASARLS